MKKSFRYIQNSCIPVILCFISFSAYTQQDKGVTFNSSDPALNEAFHWAKEKALSFAADGSDPVGYW